MTNDFLKKSKIKGTSCEFQSRCVLSDPREAGSRWTISQTGVRALGVVEAHPRLQRTGAVSGTRIRGGIRPVAGERLNEALGLAVGLRPIRAGAEMPQVRVPGDGLKGVREVGLVVIRQHAFRPHPVPSEPAHAPAQEPSGAGPFAGGQDFDVRHPTVVVDADVDILPAQAPHLARPIPVDAVPHPTNAGQALHIEVQQFARPLPFIPSDRGRRDQPGQPIETGPCQHRSHRRPGHLQPLRNRPGGVALVPWHVARVELKPEDERVDVWLEHEPTRWPCPNCGETLPAFDHAAERT